MRSPRANASLRDRQSRLMSVCGVLILISICITLVITPAAAAAAAATVVINGKSVPLFNVGALFDYNTAAGAAAAKIAETTMRQINMLTTNRTNNAFAFK
jgi:hypothetical protein